MLRATIAHELMHSYPARVFERAREDKADESAEHLFLHDVDSAVWWHAEQEKYVGRPLDQQEAFLAKRAPRCLAFGADGVPEVWIRPLKEGESFRVHTLPESSVIRKAFEK